MQQEEVLSLPEVYEPDEITTVVAPEPETVSAQDELRRELAELLAEIPPPAATETSEPDLAEIPPESAPEQSEPVDELILLSPHVAVGEQDLASSKDAEAEPKPHVVKGYGKEWILQQRAEHYTYQLMGSWEMLEVDEFIEKNALSGDYARFSSLRDGKPWHVIVYGVYPSKKAALKASNQWPAPMTTLPTWLRRFDSVQKQIKEKGVKP
jgi:DamX protein